MCPEYDIYHTRFPQDQIGFMSNEKAQFISLTDIKVSYFLSREIFSVIIDKITRCLHLFQTMILIMIMILFVYF
jgi:hypothetical protein